MSPELMEIIKQGGPLGFAMLFAWLWMRSEKRLENEQKEHRALMMKLISRAGLDV